MRLFILILLFAGTVSASDNFLDSVSRETWNLGSGQSLEVVWVRDQKFPKFTATIYYMDGALRDQSPGETQMAFDLLTAGTTKESQREITEFFDYFGANLRHSVTHEYSIFTIEALTRDINPVMSKVCEIFNDAAYPIDKVNSHIQREQIQLKNLVTSHSALADRVFRRISLDGTEFAQPSGGTLKSLSKIDSVTLKKRLDLLNRTKKILFLTGPSDVKIMKSVLAKKCKWSNEIEVAKQTLKKSPSQSAIYLVPVPKANQAQIRIGRYLVSDEFKTKFDHLYFLSGFLGGGFTSKLVQELRVKRGLTYSAGAYVSMLRDYGRAGIATFSKTDTVAQAVSLIRNILEEVSKGKFESKELHHQKNHQIGGYAFNFEKSESLLSQLMLLNHQGRRLDELIQFPNNIEKLTTSGLSATNLEVFPWEKQVIVIVGEKKLLKKLSQIRPVRIVDYQDYL